MLAVHLPGPAERPSESSIPVRTALQSTCPIQLLTNRPCSPDPRASPGPRRQALTARRAPGHAFSPLHVSALPVSHSRFMAPLRAGGFQSFLAGFPLGLHHPRLSLELQTAGSLRGDRDHQTKSHAPEILESRRLGESIECKNSPLGEFPICGRCGPGCCWTRLLLSQIRSPPTAFAGLTRHV